MDTDGIVKSINTKDILKDIKNLEEMFHFNKLNENQELHKNKNEIVVGKFKLETPKNNWIDEFVALRSKMYAFKCGDDSKIKIKRN